MITYSLAEASSYDDHKLLYESTLATQEQVNDWVMEGPGKVTFNKGWMRMFSPGIQMHHVFWCPQHFPGSFIAEWEIQNLNPRSGLLIVFFAAQGLENKGIFEPALGSRDGTFAQYTKGDIKSYHISYYANSLTRPNRGTLHLRKNPGFHLVAQSRSPLQPDSESIHRIRLEKNRTRIKFYIDDREVLDWTDSGKMFGPALSEGRIGFRQMRSTDFQYRNFRVYAIPDESSVPN